MDGDPPPPAPPAASVALMWIPLGAGGVGYVRLNGRLYERIAALRRRRPPLDLYHTALEVRTPEGRFTVENAWPSPDTDIASRGVVTEGPVFSHRLMRMRAFRYEIRCWRDGVIPDASQATVTHLWVVDPDQARNLLEQVAAVPPLIWGRSPPGTGDMWNSNSVIAFLLTRSGLLDDGCRPPTGGRAPGWEAGVATARLDPPSSR